MDPLDMEHLKIGLQEKYDVYSISEYDVLSAALYPKVYFSVLF
jgi:pyruvate carboxylase